MTSSSSSSSPDEDAQDTQLTSSATSVYQDASQQDASSARTRVTLVLRQIIAEETRMVIDELKPSTSLGDIGIDSLLSLTISGKLQELLDADNPSTIFMEVETLQELEDALCNTLGLGPSHPIKLSKPFTDDHTALKSSFSISNSPMLSDRQNLLGDTQHQSIVVSSSPHATSILLSGSPQTAQLILIIFPDGSGSASSYAALAPVVDTSRVAVYGLNCPWRKTGAEMTRLGVTMSTMVARYLIKVRQLVQQQQQLGARSPFIALGGWSAGGILAFEAARQLQQQPGAIRISRLILFDSPYPIGLHNPRSECTTFLTR
jgi:naphtho-gamma-pyrone polyketide synthase